MNSLTDETWKKRFFTIIAPIISRQAVGGISSLLISMLLLRIFGKSDFGVWTFLLLLLSVPNIFFQPIFTGLLRFLPEQTKDTQIEYFIYVFQVSAMLWLCTTTIGFLILYNFPDIISPAVIDNQASINWILILGILFSKCFIEFLNFSISSLCLALQNVLHHQTMLFIKRVLELFLICLFFIYQTEGNNNFLDIAVILLTLELLLLLYWMSWLTRKIKSFRFKRLTYSFFQRREVSEFFMPFLGMSLFAIAGKRAAIFLLGYLQLYETLALFTILDRVFNLANKFAGSFFHTISPYYSKINKSALLKSAIAFNLSLFFGVSSLALLLFSPYWLKFWSLEVSEDLSLVLLFFSINLCLMGIVQGGGQRQLQQGTAKNLFRIAVARRAVFFVFLYLFHDNLLSIVVAETAGIIAAVIIHIFIQARLKSSENLNIATTFCFLLGVVCLYSLAF